MSDFIEEALRWLIEELLFHLLLVKVGFVVLRLFGQRSPGDLPSALVGVATWLGVGSVVYMLT